MSEYKKPTLSRRALFATAAATTALPLAVRAQGTSPLGVGAPINSTTTADLPTQGGVGPIRVLFVTAFHAFDRENLFRMLDRFGEDITWTHIEHPAAEHFFDPELAKAYDVFLFYDAFAGRVKTGLDADGEPVYEYRAPSEKLQADLKQLLINGDKGLVFFHHSLASWVHTWPAGVSGTNAYIEVMGAAADWGKDIKNVRGVDYPKSGYRQGTEQRFTVVDRNHPITAGITDFDLVDEPYLCPVLEDSVHPLLSTDFKAEVEAFAHAPNRANVGDGHPSGSNLAGWYKSAENSPVVYIQPGHDNNAWSHPAYEQLMLNAIKWAASQEAKDWARANATKIFS